MIINLRLILFLIFLFNSDNYISKSEAYTVNVKRRDARAAEAPTTTEAALANGHSKAVESAEYENNDANQENDSVSGLLKRCDPCPEGIRCVPQIQCPAHVRMKDHEKPQICDLPGDRFGYCCLTGQNHTATRSDRERIPSPAATAISMNVLEEARRKFEKLMHNIASKPVEPGWPDFLHGIAFHSSPQEDIQNFELTNNAMEQVITTQVLTKEEQISVEDIISNNVDVEFKDTPLEHHCLPQHKCGMAVKSPYRSFDGSCNNPLPYRNVWGAAGQPMQRLLPPAYEDGVWTPRMHSTDGRPLPSAREVSRVLLSDIHRPSPRYNLLLMQFGQFIAHDVSQTASVRLEGGELVACCTPDGSAPLPPESRHFACLPINVDAADEFYSVFNVRCLNFVRLSLAPQSDCRVGYGKQRSKVTHFLDASPVYGSSVETAQDLRSFHGGRLRMLNDFGRELLPLNADRKACESDEPGKTCFKSGDGRTNQIISLIAMHIVFSREHNRLADALAAINPHWSDELLYQEARRILIAEYQHIVYNEYLPAIIGPMQMKRFRLVPQHHGYAAATDYSSDINPSITNEFSGAAFRMGHSSVDGKFHVQTEGQVGEIVNIPDVMFNPSRMRMRTFYDDMLNTLLRQPMQKVDSSITEGLSRYLFRGHNPFGIDLAAINIQRGRDQGLRPYNDYLELMGNRKIHSFDQLPPEIGRKLAAVYHSPDDIDLWIGGLLEKPVADGVVGITFAEIIADQFSRFKRGDRYYYEYGNSVNPGAFTVEQLHEIRKASMARILCDNSDHLTLMEVPLAAFVRADLPSNEPVRCDSPHIPSINLEAWRV